MKKLWRFTGIVVFWLTWPALWFYLKGSSRTRVVVHVGDELLMVKAWLGPQSWGLPGGGLHKGEGAAKGALRELQEETGIVCKPSQLKLLYKNKKGSDHGLPYVYSCFVVELPEKVTVTIQQPELIAADWILKDRLLADKKLGKVTRDIIAAWSDDRDLLH